MLHKSVYAIGWRRGGVMVSALVYNRVGILLWAILSFKGVYILILVILSLLHQQCRGITFSINRYRLF